MRVALIGSADFGKAALEAFLDRGDEVVAVFCPPDNPKSSKPEVLKEAALARGLNPLQFASLKGSEAAQAMIDSSADICVMAYVIQFVPQELCKIPKHGTIDPCAVGLTLPQGALRLTTQHTYFSSFTYETCGLYRLR